MATPVETRRIIQLGAGSYIVIPPKMLQMLGWNRGDTVAMRYVEGKLLLDRVPLEGLARVKAGVVGE